MRAKFASHSRINPSKLQSLPLGAFVNTAMVAPYEHCNGGPLRSLQWWPPSSEYMNDFLSVEIYTKLPG